MPKKMAILRMGALAVFCVLMLVPMAQVEAANGLTLRPEEISGGAAVAGQSALSAEGQGILGRPGVYEPLTSMGFISGSGFEAYDFDDNSTETGGFVFIPPDPCGAAGLDRVIAVVNVGIEARTKAGALIFRDSLKDFFSPLGAPATLGTFTFDPKIVYDHYEGRFVVVTLERADVGAGGGAGDESRILIAVSKTASPATATAADWYFTWVDSKTIIGAGATWADYPGFEVDEEAVYITNNMFPFSTSAGSFGTRLWIVDKGVAGGFYGGGPAVITVHDPYAGGGFAGTTMPALVFGAAGAGPGIGTYLVSYSSLTIGGPGANEAVQVIRVDDPLGGGGGPFFTQEFVFVGDIEDVGGAFGFPALPDAPQLGSAQTIEVNDSRALDAVWRNGDLWFTTTINPNVAYDAVNNGQATAHWFKLNTSAVTSSASPAGLIVTADQGNIGGEDIAPATWTFFPSVAVNSAGTAKFGFAGSASSIYGGAYVAGREAGDPAGTVGPTGTVHAGVDWYYRAFGGTRNRWGDYSGISVDPADDRIFWVFNEYAETRGTVISGEDGRWGTAWLSCALSCLSLDCPPDSVYAKNTAATVVFCINNCGALAEDYDYALGDTQGWFAPQAGTVNVPAGGQVCITAAFTTPNTCVPVSNLIRFQAQSSGGESDSCVVTVGADNLPPVALCKDITVVGDSTVVCTANYVVPGDVDDGSYDPDGDTFTLALDPAGPYTLGTTTVALIATDICGRSDTCYADITVECPVPVKLAMFEVARSAGGAILQWEVSEATDHAGFHVYRQVDGADRVRLTDGLLSGRARYEFTDPTAPAGDVDYWLAEISRVGETIWHGPATLGAGANVSAILTLLSSPNPFTASTAITFNLPESRSVRLAVYDMQGRRVRTLIDAMESPGEHTVTWNGRSDSGRRTAAGLYILRLEAGPESLVKKIVFSR